MFLGSYVDVNFFVFVLLIIQNCLTYRYCMNTVSLALTSTSLPVNVATLGYLANS